MSMPGGGPHMLAPGQVTDDSELAMSLMHGLVEGEGKLDMSKVVRYYGLWFQEGPFDRGTTTSNALREINPDKPNPLEPRSAALQKNRKSMSNGSLMKITPMAVYCQNLPNARLKYAVEQDVVLIHSCYDMKGIVAAYCIAIKSLIQNHDSASRAQTAFDDAKNFIEDKLVQEWLAEAQSLVGKETDSFITLKEYDP